LRTGFSCGERFSFAFDAGCYSTVTRGKVKKKKKKLTENMSTSSKLGVAGWEASPPHDYTQREGILHLLYFLLARL
jgi:hypothetical protein